MASRYRSIDTLVSSINASQVAGIKILSLKNVAVLGFDVENLRVVSESKRWRERLSVCVGAIDPLVVVVCNELGFETPMSTSVLSLRSSEGKVPEFLDRTDCEEDPSDMNDCLGSSYRFC